MSMWRSQQAHPSAYPFVPAPLEALTSVLDQFWSEYAKNRESGIDDRKESLCMALASVLPPDDYMPVIKMLIGVNDREFSVGIPFDGKELRERLMATGDKYWKQAEDQPGELPPPPPCRSPLRLVTDV